MGFFRTLGTPAQAMPREETRTLDIGGRAVPLAIRTNPRARRLTLRIAPGGAELRLTVPPGARRKDVDAFLSRHEGWARERLSRLADVPPVEPGASVPVGGVPHLIDHTGRLRGLTERVEGEPPLLRVSGPEERTAARVANYLKTRARTEIEEAVARHASVVGREPKSVRVKDTRSRWGSCTHDGALSFSWRLAMAPPWIVDYLAAHECAHLRHMDHGPQFWALCRELAPRTDEAKTWLKEHGQRLHAYDFG